MTIQLTDSNGFVVREVEMEVPDANHIAEAYAGQFLMKR